MASDPKGHKRPRLEMPSRADHTIETDRPSRLQAPTSPYMPMFEAFKTALDDHHDRRERVIKASRDVTANSKKMIFSLQRVCQYGSPLPETTLRDIKPFEETCASLLSSLVPELQGINAWRYQRQVSPGIQEFMEASIFSHYLQHQRLLDPRAAQALLPDGMLLTDEDWLGGIMDSVGECMRWAITGMASQGKIPGDVGAGAESSRDQNIAQDLRELRAALEALRIQGPGAGKDASKKMDVMKSCVDKVESAAYSLIVRGQERPKGWVPSLNEQPGPAPEYE